MEWSPWLHLSSPVPVGEQVLESVCATPGLFFSTRRVEKNSRQLVEKGLGYGSHASVLNIPRFPSLPSPSISCLTKWAYLFWLLIPLPPSSLSSL